MPAQFLQWLTLVNAPIQGSAAVKSTNISFFIALYTNNIIIANIPFGIGKLPGSNVIFP